MITWDVVIFGPGAALKQCRLVWCRTPKRERTPSYGFKMSEARLARAANLQLRVNDSWESCLYTLKIHLSLSIFVYKQLMRKVSAATASAPLIEKYMQNAREHQNCPPNNK